MIIQILEDILKLNSFISSLHYHLNYFNQLFKSWIFYIFLIQISEFLNNICPTYTVITNQQINYHIIQIIF